MYVEAVFYFNGLATYCSCRRIETELQKIYIKEEKENEGV